jgi:hypothetical protein
VDDIDRRVKRKGQSIQDICTQYFEKMQGEIDRYIIVYNDMRDSYDSWNKNIKKPFDLKEAALFALEARILNEEHARINEAITVKDVINKLIYSV